MTKTSNFIVFLIERAGELGLRSVPDSFQFLKLENFTYSNEHKKIFEEKKLSIPSKMYVNVISHNQLAVAGCFLPFTEFRDHEITTINLPEDKLF